MSFSSRVKSEIIDKGFSSDAEKKAFLAGFVRATGSIIEKDGNYGFEFSVESGKTADFTVFLMDRLFGYRGAELTGGGTRVTVECVGIDAVKVLEDLGIIKENSGNYSLRTELDGLYESGAERRAFIKGVFIGGGNVTVPVKMSESRTSTGYHLEFVFFGYEPALEFTSFLAAENIFTKLTERKGNYVIYIKSSEEIKDFLAYAGAPKAVLELTEIIVEKEITAGANRRTNCDLANVNKQMNAAERLINAIGDIEDTVGLDALNLQLREAADARRAYPEDTLQELADKLGVSKSCLNHRFRKIFEINKNISG